MKTKKMSLANIKGKLSRAEMKQIMAGSGTYCPLTCAIDYDCGPCGPNWRCFSFNGKNQCVSFLQ